MIYTGTAESRSRFGARPVMKKLTVLWKALLGVIILFMLGIWIYFGSVAYRAYQFNESDKIVLPGDTDAPVVMSIEPRGLKSDTWTSQMSDRSTLFGEIYNAVIENRSGLEMDNWHFRLNIHNDCYLNNSWCGDYEIHQLRPEGELVQYIDLQDYVESEVILEHVMLGTEILVTLHEGDYVIYTPSAIDGEDSIPDNNSVTVGIIFYAPDRELDLSDFMVTYDQRQPVMTNQMRTNLLFSGILMVVAGIALIVTLRTQRKLEENEKNIEGVLKVISSFVDAKDTYTRGHSTRVADYSMKIAEALGYKEESIKNVYYVALMHDCGKCYIPDEILKKPGRLTEEEFLIIKDHSSKGGEMMDGLPFIKNAADGARYHHERYDGSGYPAHLKGEEIPEIGRIICIADSFDAMNSHRCYRRKLSLETIVEELNENKGKQFDPHITDVFIDLLNRGRIDVDWNEEDEEEKEA